MDASEYGQHWNFFFTLGALELLTMAAPQEPASAGASGASWHITCQSRHASWQQQGACGHGEHLTRCCSSDMRFLPEHFWGYPSH